MNSYMCWTWGQWRRAIACQRYDVTVTVGGLETTRVATNLGATCTCAVCRDVCSETVGMRCYSLTYAPPCLSCPRGTQSRLQLFRFDCLAWCWSYPATPSLGRLPQPGARATRCQGSSHVGGQRLTNDSQRREPMTRRKPRDRDRSTRPSPPDPAARMTVGPGILCRASG